MDSIDKIKRLIKENELFCEEDKIVVGISGGADSVCLLLILKEVLKVGNLTAVHINHGIRGDEAKRDENFVRYLCEKYNISLEIREYDIPLFSKRNKISEEEAGRILRYRAFEEIRLSTGSDKIAVAHNVNDTTETFIMNLIRGSGLTGLTGIKIKAGNIVRPLIKTNRTEIEDIVRYYGESFITDSTNESLIYARNRIRNKVIPELKGVNERAIEHINEACEKLKRVEEFIMREVDRAYDKYVNSDKDILIKNETLEVDEVLADEIIHRAIIKASGKAKDIGYIHISGLKALMLKQVGREISLPYKLRAYRDYDGIRLMKAEKTGGEIEASLPAILLDTIEIGEISEVVADESNIKLIFKDGSIKNLPQNSCIKWFDYDKITETVLLRYKKEGDYIIISEKGDKKKLKKYFIDMKIPAEMRNEIPVVASGGDILWVVGYRTGEGAKITQSTGKILKMEIRWK